MKENITEVKILNPSSPPMLWELTSNWALVNTACFGSEKHFAWDNKEVTRRRTASFPRVTEESKWLTTGKNRGQVTWDTLNVPRQDAGNL